LRERYASHFLNWKERKRDYIYLYKYFRTELPMNEEAAPLLIPEPGYETCKDDRFAA